MEKYTSNLQCYIFSILFLQDKDEYGNEVTHLARPLPVEYLLVDMNGAFPVEPIYSFKVADNPFPMENRRNVGEVQVSCRFSNSFYFYFVSSSIFIVSMSMN